MAGARKVSSISRVVATPRPYGFPPRRNRKSTRRPSVSALCLKMSFSTKTGSRISTIGSLTGKYALCVSPRLHPECIEDRQGKPSEEHHHVDRGCFRRRCRPSPNLPRRRRCITSSPATPRRSPVPKSGVTEPEATFSTCSVRPSCRVIRRNMAICCGS